MPQIQGLGPKEDTLCEMFFNRAKRQPNHAFIWTKQEYDWVSHSWGDVANQVEIIASALAQRGITAGARVAILSENRLEWIIADLAIMSIGAISVPLFTTYTQTDITYLLSHSGARAIICSNSELTALAETAAQDSRDCYLMVVIEQSKLLYHSLNLAIVGWSELIEEGRVAIAHCEFQSPEMSADDVCCIIYSSDGDEKPKGAMLTHRSIMANLAGAEGLLRDLSLGREVFLSMLPLSHAYEHSVGLFFPIHIRAEIYLLHRPETLSSAIIEVKPTIMTAVPRLYEILRDRIHASYRHKGILNRKMLDRAVYLGRKNVQKEPITLLEKIENSYLNLTVRRHINARLGGRLKAFVSGAAALDPNIGYFFLALNVRILQGYGQTEASPVIAANPPKKIKIETVGKLLVGVEAKFTKLGEICIRGDLVMKGYWNDPVATKKKLRDGWLLTGDIGTFHPDGYISLTGRKKDIIINSGGDNISPVKIETVLEAHSDIDQAMAYGNQHSYITAVITPNHLLAKKLQYDQTEIANTISEAIKTANARLSSLEKVRSFILSEEPFSIENECLTASGALKRQQINQLYSERLEQLYQRKTS
ncbi:MAG: AMP-binding protein [Alphaproteobacteria bacterium]|nr:AMP-binding protein [Alphaproteobacteria bacterium]